MRCIGHEPTDFTQLPCQYQVIAPGAYASVSVRSQFRRPFRHFKYPLFECLHPGCGKQFHWLRNDALNHVLRKHGGDESLVRDNNHLYHGQVNAHRKEFFDTTARIMPEELASLGLPLPSRKSVFPTMPGEHLYGRSIRDVQRCPISPKLGEN